MKTEKETAVQAEKPAIARTLELARNLHRPTIRDLLPHIMEEFFEQRGDRRYGDDPAICAGIARLNGRPVTVIGHVKGNNTLENVKANFGMPQPEGYRKALRAMEQAEKFGRPVICFIDTPGAHCGIGAEERGQGEAIARCLYESMWLKVPVVSVVTGEGGSGGALALAVGNEVLMLENAVYSVISPKGFASILWKDASREYEAAELMRITAPQLLELGVIDTIVPEPPEGAHSDVPAAAEYIRLALLRSLSRFEGVDGDKIAQLRYEKFRKIGKMLEE